MYLIVYETSDKRLIYRLVKSNYLKVGDIRLSSGYKCISKGIYYNNRFINEKDYLNILEKKALHFTNSRKHKISFKKNLYKITFFLLFIFLINNVVIKFVIYILSLIV